MIEHDDASMHSTGQGSSDWQVLALSQYSLDRQSVSLMHSTHSVHVPWSRQCQVAQSMQLISHIVSMLQYVHSPL
jgi:hypothetical protein